MSSLLHWKWRSIGVFLLLVSCVLGVCEKTHIVGLWLPKKVATKVKHVASQSGTAESEYQMVVKGRLSEVQACYNEELKKGLINRQGKLVVQWAVDSDGHTSNFAEEQNELDSPELYSCTIKSIASWPFPKNQNLMIRYTFRMHELEQQKVEREISSLEDLGHIGSSQITEENTD